MPVVQFKQRWELEYKTTEDMVVEFCSNYPQPEYRDLRCQMLCLSDAINMTGRKAWVRQPILGYIKSLIEMHSGAIKTDIEAIYLSAVSQ